MQEQRAKQGGVPAADFAGDLACGIPQPPGSLIRYAPVAVGTGNNAQGSIFRAAGVQMHANGKQSLQQFHGSLHEMLTLLP